MSWVPTTDFEEEVVNLQPGHNFIYGSLNEPEVFYPRPKSHIEYVTAQKSEKSNQSTKNHKLDVIATVQKIAGTKPLGEMPTLKDWDDDENIEQETIAMMRHCGLGPSVEEPLDEKRTIATLPVANNVQVMYNGRKRMPIFFGDQYFKLKSRNSPEFEGVTHSADVSSDISSELSVLSCSQSPEEEYFRDIEKHNKELNTVCNESSHSGFQSAVSSTKEESFVTAKTEDFIPTRTWYSRKKKNGGNRRYNSSTVFTWGIMQSQEAESRQSEKKTIKQKQKEQGFYTPKELYDMKRTN